LWKLVFAGTVFADHKNTKIATVKTSKTLEAHSYSAIMVYKETKYLHSIVNYHMTSNTHCSRTCATMGPLKKEKLN